LFANIE